MEPMLPCNAHGLDDVAPSPTEDDPQPAFTDHAPDPDTDYRCFVKAKDRGEPTFTLRAQDVTADIVVDFWVRVQQKVRRHMDAGLTMMQAVQAVRSYYVLEPDVPASDLKLSGACRIAGEMEKWPNRKLAD